MSAGLYIHGRTEILTALIGDDAALRVFLALSAFANVENEGWCWPYQKTIANVAGVHQSTVSRALDRLVEDGYIERRKRESKRGGRTSYEHRVRLDWPSPPQNARENIPAGISENAPRAFPEEHSQGTEPLPSTSSQVVAPKRKRAAQISPDLQLDTAWLNEAVKIGVNPVEVSNEFSKFKDYWLGLGKPRADWLATWRNWCRNALKWAQQRQPQVRRSGPPDPLADCMRDHGFDPAQTAWA